MTIQTFILPEDAEAAEPTPTDSAELAWRIDPKRDPVALVFASSSDEEYARPHVVTVAHLGAGDTLTCTCAAVRALGYRPAGCWAMVRAREIIGMPE